MKKLDLFAYLCVGVASVVEYTNAHMAIYRIVSGIDAVYICLCIYGKFGKGMRAPYRFVKGKTFDKGARLNNASIHRRQRRYCNERG